MPREAATDLDGVDVANDKILDKEMAYHCPGVNVS